MLPLFIFVILVWNQWNTTFFFLQAISGIMVAPNWGCSEIVLRKLTKTIEGSSKNVYRDADQHAWFVKLLNLVTSGEIGILMDFGLDKTAARATLWMNTTKQGCWWCSVIIWSLWQNSTSNGSGVTFNVLIYCLSLKFCVLVCCIYNFILCIIQKKKKLNKDAAWLQRSKASRLVCKVSLTWCKLVRVGKILRYRVLAEFEVARRAARPTLWMKAIDYGSSKLLRSKLAHLACKSPCKLIKSTFLTAVKLIQMANNFGIRWYLVW